MGVLKGLIDNKILKILTVFLNNPSEYYHINKVSQLSNVSLATTFRIINQLADTKIIESKQIGKFKIYRLCKNSKTKKLRRII